LENGTVILVFVPQIEQNKTKIKASNSSK